LSERNPEIKVLQNSNIVQQNTIVQRYLHPFPFQGKTKIKITAR